MSFSARRSFLFAAFIAGTCLRGPLDGQSAQPQSTAGLTQYTFGTPSGDETEMLAEINRARANPAAEGQRIVDGVNAVFPNGGSGIDLPTLLSQFQSYPARPPLAFNADLNASAQAHTAEMVATGVLQHNSSDGTPVGYRIKSFGYATPEGENCDGTAGHPRIVKPWTTETDYEIDQNVPGYGHRLTLMEPTYVASVEIGVAQHALGGWNTEDFGANGMPPLVTGVVFTDNVGTSFYQSGEGVGGVIVTAPGASSFYAVTTASGAYTLPLDLVPVYQPAPYLDQSGPYPVYVVPPPTTAPPPTVQVVFTDPLGNVTTKAVTLTHTVGTDGNSTYFDAQENIRYDNVEADLVEPAVVSAHPVFFHGEFNFGGSGVYYLALPHGNVFGYYSYLSDPRFIYHMDMGYEYVQDASDGKAGMYLYDFKSNGWFYTSPSFPFPYLYDFALNTVLYYYPDPDSLGHYNTNGVRYFYRFDTGQIIVK